MTEKRIPANIRSCWYPKALPMKAAMWFLPAPTLMPTVIRSWAALAIWYRPRSRIFRLATMPARRSNIINQKLGYLVRGGDPDAIDSIVPMAYGNLALDLILMGIHGRLVVLKNGRYDNMPIDVVTATKKLVQRGQVLQQRALETIL
jgi:hypothetical protein